MDSATLTPKVGSIQPRRVDTDPYAALNAAIAVQTAAPDSPSAALTVCRAYIALGLIGPAREFLCDENGPLAGIVGARPLRDQIAIAPSGRIAWATLQERFDSNLHKLLIARPELRVHEQILREARKRLEIYRSSDGNQHLARRAHDGRLIWREMLIDTRRVVAETSIPHASTALICPPYCICHDRFCMLLAKLYAATRKMLLTFSPRLYLLTRDLDDLAAAMHLSSDIGHLCDPRVDFLMGTDCAERLAELLRSNPDRQIPEKLLCLPSADSMQEHVLMQLRTVIKERHEQLCNDVQRNIQVNEKVDPGVLSDRFANFADRPLRILGITSRFTTVLQYSMRDLAAAFDRKGHSFHTLMDPSDHDVMPPEKIAAKIRELQPDLVISIDHLRSEFGQLIPPNIPYVCWIQDLLPNLMNAKAGQSVGPRDAYIAQELKQFVRTYQYPPERGMVWTMATDPGLYDATPLPETEWREFRSDFSFVSNQSMPPQVFHAGYKRNVTSQDGRRLCDHIFERLRHEFDTGAAVPRSATRIIAEARDRTGLGPADAEVADRLGRNFVHPLTELFFRQSTLRWVAEYCETRNLKLSLYGRGWEANPRFAPFARGVAQNGHMLRAIYQASKVNLQINGYGAIHQRLLDGLASGGFFMIRHSPFDHLHRPAKELLEQVRLHDLKPGSYDPKRYPELARAWRAANLCNGIDLENAHDVQLTQEEIDSYMDVETAEYRRVAGAVFADYRQVAFTSPEDFAQGADRFLADESQRRGITSRMREAVLARFTYDALVDALISFLARMFRAADPSPDKCLRH